eukprot:gene6522-4700_t
MAASLVEMTTESSTAIQSEERRDLFDGMDPDIMLKMLVTVPAEECIAALRPMSRPELDANHSGGDQVTMWARLAEMFNDYDTYKYTNAVIGGIDSLGMEQLMLYCDDINPSSPNRPLRDALWIRTQYRELKTKITVCYSNYKRSGYQDAQNKFDEWVKFCTPFSNDVVVYAGALFDVEGMEPLGRALPIDVQRDTGAIDPADTRDVPRSPGPGSVQEMKDIKLMKVSWVLRRRKHRR